MQLGQFSAAIAVGGEPLPEYAVEYSADGMEATCWIASENDKQFCIKLKNNDASPSRRVSGKVLLDGTKCGGLHLRISTKRGGNVSTAKRDSVPTSANTRRPLTFSKQILTDDDAYLDGAISPDLGTIRVVFTLVKPCDGSGKSRWHNRELPRVVHERSKKAIGHSVQFGPEFYCRNSQASSLTIKELATLVFRYRPIDLLRAQGIAPPAVRPARAATTTDVIDLSMDVDDEEETDETEIKKLEMRLNALRNKNKNNNNKGTQVKREPSNANVKKEIKNEELIFTPGEIIDLT
ncbi:hypothetical protein MVEN_02143900 [Mycena venus]|uniref:DUF7918 domain-containing protein n=1 Tax=Mycena venus TaxID=2733690 RepID=A0A8H6X9S1_9AGAR|nr:hypothetical protein MVEN_02143900 [Mycena venus]